ncbi:hypothetical protein EIP91_002217 [Steccherinum ochraceum]|uniref:SUN domain-containing protein n=1 Tax=Steccherinum ochraceum TaxID=92696 RepID=A0A4R0RPP9_9APHY|nr:hypothetical protein EIP91_002217 [Steccherinum ochraceum]
MFFSYSHLPLPLLALLLTALPALSGPTTPYDPFHDIAIHAPKPAEQPICCLRPLVPLDEAEEDVLLTFEEWKAKRLAEVVKEHVSASHSPSGNGHKPGTTEDAPDPIPSSSAGRVASSVAVPVADVDVPPERISPHFQIPIHDRFNYASMDCSARVHNAHKSAKSASSILSSKKDRYMLSPCNAKEQFVVIELCDDIRIDTVQLANYEFFSGVFKDFSVSVSKTYTGPYVPAGTFRGKNTRGVQSFHPPSLTDFYRFIRIDFHTHYGNEYYCPLSLFRVYGLTHLESWKWDLWEDESRRASGELAARETLDAADAGHDPETVSGNGTGTSNGSSPISSMVDVSSTEEHPTVSVLSNASSSDLPKEPPTSRSSSTADSSQPPASSVIVPATNPPESPEHLAREHSTENISSPSPSSSSSLSSEPTAETSSVAQRSSSSDTNHTSLSTSSFSIPASSAIPSVSNSTTANASHTSREASNSSVQSQAPQSSRSTASPIHTAHSLTVIPPNPGGESIYRIIMNRLTALEANTTLYARYAEEQLAGLRDMMRRLGEDVGRLESIGKAQAQMYQRSVTEFERHRKRIDLEYAELMSTVNRLTDEVILEKRLGIAQLCTLLIVLIFISLTRGSRSEVVHPPTTAGHERSRTNSMQPSGKRTLSLGGLSTDLINRFRSPSREPTLTSPISDSERTEKASPDEDKVKFPTRNQQPPATADLPRSKRTHPAPNGRKLMTNVHVRTPTSLRSPMRSANSHRYAFRPLTPTNGGPATASLTSAALVSPRPQFSRSSSSGAPGSIVQSASMGSVIGPVPKSAKRWARSAHLHEVKSMASMTRLNTSTSTIIPTPTVPAKELEPSITRVKSRPVEIDEVQDVGGLVGDVFSEQVIAPTPWTPGRRKESMTMHLARVGLSPSDMSPGRVSLHATNNAELSEGESGGWVDTDVDSSDVDNEEMIQED